MAPLPPPPPPPRSSTSLDVGLETSLFHTAYAVIIEGILQTNFRVPSFCPSAHSDFALRCERFIRYLFFNSSLKKKKKDIYFCLFIFSLCLIVCLPSLPVFFLLYLKSPPMSSQVEVVSPRSDI